jgi:TrmH family RNA methyltransferase
VEPGLSHRNPRLVEAARLHRTEARSALGLTLLEGPHLVGEAVETGASLREIFALEDDPQAGAWARASRTRITVVGEMALRRLSSTRAPQSPVAVMEIPRPGLDPSRSLLVSGQIADPTNLGAMIRIGAAFGLDVGVLPGSADPWSPRALRAGAGGHFRTRVVSIPVDASLGAIKVAAVASGGLSPRRLPRGRLALLVGNEARGLPAELIESADYLVTIPMPGKTESLNAAAAAAILAYETMMRED